MTDTIRKHLSRMTADLTNDELGAAVRLLCRLSDTRESIAPARLHRVAMTTPEQWADMSSEVLRFFRVSDDGRVGHEILEADATPPIATPAVAKPGTTSELSLVIPTAPTRAPGFPDAAPGKTVSIKKAAFDTMVDLFRRSNQSESTARAVMASLIKSWPQGDVFQAIDAASRAARDDFLVDPRSWVLAWLKSNSAPLTSSRRASTITAPAPRKPARIATADFMGLTDRTAQAIQTRNKALRLKIDETE